LSFWVVQQSTQLLHQCCGTKRLVQDAYTRLGTQPLNHAVIGGPGHDHDGEIGAAPSEDFKHLFTTHPRHIEIE
jgi:hypothetical protein